MIKPPDGMMPWLEKALDVSSRRHTVLSGNLANIDTPGYRPKDLEFTEFLRAELGRSAETKRDGAREGVQSATPVASERPGMEPGLDENRVDLDSEIVRMTTNRLFHQLATEIINRKLSALRYSIDEGGR